MKKLKVRARVLAEKVVLTKTRLVVPVPQGEVEVPVVSTSHLAPGQQEVDPAVESQCPKENEVSSGTSAPFVYFFSLAEQSSECSGNV